MAIVETGHIVEITVEYIRGEADGSNVYFYNNVGLGAGLIGILGGFQDTFEAAFAALIDPVTWIKEFRARDIFEPGSSITLGLDTPGQGPIQGELMPDFVAAPLSLLHDEAGVNSGSKRVPFLNEAWTSNGKTFTPGGQLLMDGYKAIMMQGFTDNAGDGAALEPVVVGRIEELPQEYRLPATELEAIARGFGTVGAVSQGLIGHQNTRRIK